MSNVVKITKAKKKPKNRLGFLGLLLVVAVICFFLLSPIFTIDDIAVYGNKSVSEKYIVSASGILLGENILKMNKFDAIEKINDISAIESVKIRRTWPDKVTITVLEKSPIGEIGFYGSKLLISETGDVISVITDNMDTAFPILEGITVKDVTTGETLVCAEEEKLKKYLEVLKKLKEHDMLNGVVKISENDGILVSFDIGHVAVLGDTDNLQYKISLLKEIWKKEENPAYIDLRNLEKIITKPVWGMFNDERETNKDTENSNATTDLESSQEQIRGVDGEE